ncbi:MAG TPA: hypothetical protein VEX18_07860, partial [Polyangiaceae bacterium]|nr:hypothetical protein [Polyangiaceae bacterium]
MKRWRFATLALALNVTACSRQESAESRASIARSPQTETSRAQPHEGPKPADARKAERERLVTAIARRGIEHPGVLAALRAVPRHAFVPDSWADSAYEDRPLPIGHGQTISQPTVVAAMSEAVA